MKNIFYLFLVLTLTLTSCSSDDDDEHPKEKTFLEKYGDTRWSDDLNTYVLNIYKFNNDILNPFDVYINNEEQNCYIFYQIYESSFEIISNTENELIIEFVNLNDSFTLTFTIDENNNILIDGRLLTQIYDSPQICY